MKKKRGVEKKLVWPYEAIIEWHNPISREQKLDIMTGLSVVIAAITPIKPAWVEVKNGRFGLAYRIGLWSAARMSTPLTELWHSEVYAQLRRTLPTHVVKQIMRGVMQPTSNWLAYEMVQEI